jgi:hypothetical protein
MGQLIPGNSTVYIAQLTPEVDSFTYETLEEAQAKLAEFQTVETGSREYYIYSYEQIK